MVAAQSYLCYDLPVIIRAISGILAKYPKKLEGFKRYL